MVYLTTKLQIVLFRDIKLVEYGESWIVKRAKKIVIFVMAVSSNLSVLSKKNHKPNS
jgi:hypothetical protein